MVSQEAMMVIGVLTAVVVLLIMWICHVVNERKYSEIVEMHERSLDEHMGEYIDLVRSGFLKEMGESDERERY